MSETSNELIVVGTASYAGAVGYGNLYRFQVERVRAGILEEQQLMVSILASDTKNSAFLLSRLDPAKIEIGFQRGAENEPYRLAVISGFVDQNNQSWKIKHMRDA